MPKNVIQHIEWTTRQPENLKTFYGKIFDWKFFVAMPGYTMIDGIGGIFHAPDTQMPTGVTCYVNVEDLDKTEDAITAAGGRILKSREEVPGRGWFTLFTDPDNNIVAAWEAQVPVRVARKPSAAKTAAKKPKATAKPKQKKPATRKKR